MKNKTGKWKSIKTKSAEKDLIIKFVYPWDNIIKKWLLGKDIPVTFIELKGNKYRKTTSIMEGLKNE